MTNDVTTVDQRLPSDPAQLQEYYRKMAEGYAAEERRAGSSISARNGQLSVGDQPIPYNQFAAVILDAARLNTFYGESFNANHIIPPRCYAIGRSDAEMRPHPDMQRDLNWFQPQANDCLNCPQNQFGSRGQGKACSNRRRLLMLVAGTYIQGQTGPTLQPITDVNSYAAAPLLTMTLAPTSLQGWGTYVRESAAQYQRPMFGLITRVYLYPHPKHGKEAIGFETLAPIPDEWAPTIFKRHQEATTAIFEGYEPPQQPAAPGGGFYAQQQQAQQVLPPQQPPQGFQPNQQGFAAPQPGFAPNQTWNNGQG